ncbi:MAG: hypothetical protein KGJ90_05985, partial [Patescibacteria group bacterium]|nr:hypothetical protein [Patescibacteria group bacterium]
ATYKALVETISGTNSPFLNRYIDNTHTLALYETSEKYDIAEEIFLFATRKHAKANMIAKTIRSDRFTKSIYLSRIY